MTLSQLSYFLAAVRHGSFSAAADALHMAQPSLSEQVRRLEDELGVALFSRVGRGLVLTEAGTALRPHAERTLATVEDARAAVADIRELRGGTAALGMFANAPHYLVADLIEEVRRLHPELRVRLVGQNSSEIAEAVRSGELEAALLVLPVDDASLDVRPAVRDELLYVSADPEPTRSPVTIERLARARLIQYDARYGRDDPTRRQLAERAQRAGVSIEPTIELEELEAAIQLAARGLGDTYAPRAVILREGFPHNLRAVSFSPRLYDTFAFVTRRGAHLSPATRELLRLTERWVAELGRRLEAGTA